jgi:predicted SAM-dependent methyltransferase
VRERIARIIKRMQLENFVRMSLCQPLQVRRYLARTDKRVIRRYSITHGVMKLHIGCGQNILAGWLNSDYCPRSAHILHLDARRTFPFANNHFDYVFSEHVIEHLHYSDGLKMLRECRRILKETGRIRISTPDLSFLINLNSEDKSTLQKQYIKWATENFLHDAPCYEGAFVINNFFRDWGHLFIYDERTLCDSLKTAGFNRIVKCGLNESEDAALRNLENENRMPEGFLRLETITLEGTKSSP